MKEYKAYIKMEHQYTFRSGEIAEIIGMSFVLPENRPMRLCYKIKFSDGVTDLVPVADVGEELAHRIIAIVPVEDIDNSKLNITSHGKELDQGGKSFHKTQGD